MAFKIRDIDETQAPLLDHLIELRDRLVRCVVALAVAFGVCFYFAAHDLRLPGAPAGRRLSPKGEGELVYTKLYEAFFVEMKVALFAAFFVCFPIIANQLWAFVAPGLYAKEKKAFLPFLFATPMLFAAGACLAYFVVMPTAFKFFLGFAGRSGRAQRRSAAGDGRLPRSGDALHPRLRDQLPAPVLLLLLESRRDRLTRAAAGQVRGVT